MNKIIILVIVSLIIIGGYLLFRGGYQSDQSTETQSSFKVDGAENEVQVTSSNFSFNPSSFSIQRGKPVTILFQNSGIHTFTIDELGVNESLRGSQPVVHFTPTKSGTFDFYCAIPGHRERGMFGTLRVEE